LAILFQRPHLRTIRATLTPGEDLSPHFDFEFDLADGAEVLHVEVAALRAQQAAVVGELGRGAGERRSIVPFCETFSIYLFVAKPS